MARILLINPPYTFWGEGFDDLKKKTDCTPSLGLYSLAAQARRAGHGVEILDLAVRRRRFEQIPALARSFKPDLMGISAVTVNMHHAARIAQDLRAGLPGVPVVLGGPHGTALAEETLRRYPFFDAVALGEAEATLLEMVDGPPPWSWDGVAGLALAKDGVVSRTADRPLIENLDDLAFPAWDLLPGFPHGYSAPLFNFKRLPAASLLTSRGCPHVCKFCDRSGFGRRIRFHSAGYVLSMVDHLVTRYGVRHLIFFDDMFVANRKRLFAICEGLASRFPGISFSCNGRVGSMDREMLHLLKRAGCWQIAYGVESGNQDILDRIGKHQTLGKIEEAVRMTREAGIRVKGLFMMGLPGETRKTLDDTLNFAISLDLDLFQITKFTPLPGSDLYGEASKWGRFDDDWARMNMLNFVFVPEGFTHDEIERQFWEINRRFYLRAVMAYRLTRFFVTHPAALGVGLRAGLEFFGKTLRRRHQLTGR